MTMASIERFMEESRLAMNDGFVALDARIDRIAGRTVLMLALPAAVLLVLLIVVMMWVRNTVNRMLTIWERRVGQQS